MDEARLLLRRSGRMAGVERVDKTELEVTAIVESIGWPEGYLDARRGAEPSLRLRAGDDGALQTSVCWPLTALADIAETARVELKV